MRQRAERWLSTNGVVTHSKVSCGFFKHGSGYSEELELSYEFTVNEKQYEGNQLVAGNDISWSTSFPGISKARQDVKEYPAGKSVTIYYDPQRPDRNALGYGNKMAGAWVMGAGLLCIALTVILQSVR